MPPAPPPDDPPHRTTGGDRRDADLPAALAIGLRERRPSLAPGPTSTPATRLAPYLLLVALTIGTFHGVVQCDFVNFDDDEYVYGNRHIRGGLTPDNIAWGFTADFFRQSTACDYWQPVTWLSRMLDIEMFGLRPAGHHLVNLAFHLASTCLLFHVLRRMTGACWRSWFVAALFAVHPLHVEPVAWITARKDMLAGLFWMMTLWMYLRHLERPSVGRYLGVALMLGLGLMSKPVAIVLPVVLLLLDYWPLKRWSESSPSAVRVRLLLEKVPLILLCAVSVAVSLEAQAEHLTDHARGHPVFHGLTGFIRYTLHLLWPQGIAIWYPPPAVAPGPAAAIGSALVLLGVTLAAWTLRGRFPWLIVGWGWFVAGLTPVVCLKDVAMADRFTYLPSIGLFIMAAWSVARVVETRPEWRRPIVAGAAALLLLLAVISARHVSYWRDSRSLFEHALDVTTRNKMAHQNLGVVCMQRGMTDEAELHFREILLLDPDDPMATLNLGVVMARRGQFDAAKEQFRRAFQINPSLADAHNNLGTLFSDQGNPKAALLHYHQALRINPGFEMAHINIANTLWKQGNTAEAVAHYSKAVELGCNSDEPRYRLALGLVLLGRDTEAPPILRSLAHDRPNTDWEARLRADLEALARENARPAPPPSPAPKTRRK